MPLQNLSDAEIERRVGLFANHEQFCRNGLTIANKSGQTVPLILSPAQAKLDAAVRRQEAAGKPVRIISVKGRQVHFSVGCATQVFKRVAFLPGQTGIVFADVTKTLRKQYSYYRHFQTSYKTFAGVRQLTPGRPREDQLLRWDEGSEIQFHSAERGTSGHGQPARHFHATEFAYWRDASKQMTRVMPSIPYDPFTSIFIESTANGVGGPFFQAVQRARGGLDEFLFVFFGWQEHPEYSMAAPPGFEPTPDEINLMNALALTVGQLAWRRWAIANICEGSEDRFMQEYPSTAEEAFLTSGRPRFTRKSLIVMPIDREPLSGELAIVPSGLGKKIQFEADGNNRGALKLFKRPQPGKIYVVGADPSKGVDVADKGAPADPDYSAACVLDDDTGDQVAQLRERLTPDAFAEYVAALCKFYNNAFLCPEANELGFISSLLRHYPVEHIYSRHRDPDDRRQANLHDIGWLQTESTRREMIGNLETALRQRDVVIRDPTTQDECFTFVYKTNGRAEHEQGCHDDTVFSLALAVTGRMHRPKWVKPPEVAAHSEAQVIQYGSVRRRRGLTVRNRDDD